MPSAFAPPLLRRLAIGLAVAAALAATFSLYARPSMLLDLGQMIGLCG
jgi:hypothetical protein